MKLRTHIPLTPPGNGIDHHSKLLLLGSCFAENMHQKLHYFKFTTLLNPFGILFHPFAIANLVHRAVRNEEYREDEVFQYNGRWHCFDAHSAISDTSPEAVLSRLNTAINETAAYLAGASHIVITLGTAWYYRLKETGRPVANCHKVPQDRFVKELATVAEVEESISRMVKDIGSVNPQVRFIFTVSPVRHLKDGFVENQRSKAHLIAALHGIDHGAYFPAYEIMMDELRDYRFYARDMVHPNDLAIDYIWEKFSGAWVSSEALPVMKEIDDIQKGLAHKPFAPESDQHQKFLEKLQGRIARLQTGLPNIRFES